MMHLMAVGLGGFVGALLRCGLSGAVQRQLGGSFPLGTLAVNVLGCLVIGVCAGLIEHRQMFTPAVRAFVFAGVLSSFTTFSTFGYETFELVRDRSIAMAVGSVLSQVCLGLGAVWIGWVIARAA